jgi:hypothetical protein
MSASHLEKALKAVDWNALAKEFLQQTTLRDEVEAANLRLAVWARQIESAEGTSPAVTFIREMQSAGQQVAVLTALGLYKPAAAAMRTMLETAMYFSYFRAHPVELSTLLREPKYFIDKADVVDYHKLHTADFSNLEQRFGLLGRLNTWYSFISSVVHGQIPGGWMRHKSVADLKHDLATLPTVVKTFTEGAALIHDFFLCTFARDLWPSFSASAKRLLLAGLSGDQKTALGLDAA